MSAPQIPNLLSLRGRGGSSRGRVTGRSRGGFSNPAAAHDATIQGTDTDASVSRLSAVELGYLEDPFARYFVQNTGPSVRRLPIINRGTYTRTTALDRLVAAFLAGDDSGYQGKRQIVSLGAGTDTRPFRLFSHPRIRGLVYHEIDFPAISVKKRTTVQSVPVLRNIIPVNSETEGEDWHNRTLPNDCSYFCHGLDLRELARSSSGDASTAPALEGLESDIPTLIISECCLCYLEPVHAKAVISYFTSRITELSLVIYEPVRPSDPFGRQMVSNLAARRIRMPTLEVYEEVQDQKARLLEAGFKDGQEALTVQDIWRMWVSSEDKEAVDRLEGLDEVEEWELLASHYVVAWGWRGRGFEGWKQL